MLEEQLPPLLEFNIGISSFENDIRMVLSLKKLREATFDLSLCVETIFLFFSLSEIDHYHLRSLSSELRK